MKPTPVNAQYNVAAPGSLAVRVAGGARRRMFEAYCHAFAPRRGERVLDVGVTSDQSYETSNYFEAWYPFKDQITAVGLDDARFLEVQYPGLHYVRADALALPFEDQSFDVVHSSAVIEHVGSRDNQARMIQELCRVARRGVFLTTPNRWFPVEFHTVLPLVHWLPPRAFRRIVRTVHGEFFAQEKNLNLLSPRDMRRCCDQVQGLVARVRCQRLLGWPSNILAVLVREAAA